MSDLQGKTICGYTIKSQLGIGGMAEVWYAENKIGKKAAIKLLLPKFCDEEAVVSRFITEAKVMVVLDHPNIRQVYDYDNLDGRPAIVMEYLDGDDLKARMKGGQKFTNDELKKWWNQLVDALKYTHEEGIVHRDIKPGNIFIDKKGNVKLLDFGIAKVRESISSTQTGQKIGTLMYMSPEQVLDSKHIDYHTDIYSLAVTFVHLLTGKRPYDSENSSDYMIQNQIVTKPLDLSEVPAEWRYFLEPYLDKDPKNRPELRPFEVVAQPSQKPTQKPEDAIDDEKTIIENTAVKPGRTEAKAFESKTFTVNGVSFDMIAVKGGTFTMGGTFEQGGDCLYDEKPTHSVTLSDYYIGKFEVTQELWQAVMGNNPSYFKGNNLPVNNVSWNDVQEFITKLNQKTGANFRLPTEAEWEYAARGGNKSKGYKYSGSNTIGNVAWYLDNSSSKTHQVGTKSPNELGIYDMSGNVFEWCQDWYGNYSSGSQTNPTGPSSGSRRVFRGGSWISYALHCRVSDRGINAPDSRYSNVGFRLAAGK